MEGSYGPMTNRIPRTRGFSTAAAIVTLGLCAGVALGASFILTLAIVDSPLPQANALFGRVANVGDVTGDGGDDLGIVASAQRNAFLVSGADFSPLVTITIPVNAEGAGRPTAVGDVNNDTIPDVAIPAPLQNIGGRFEQGQVWVFSGADGTIIHTLNDPFPQSGARFGNALSAVGDVDGDAVLDIGVGTLFQNGTFGLEGQAFVFSGATGVLLYSIPHPFPQCVTTRTYLGGGER